MWDVIRLYRTQSAMKVGSNQPIICEVHLMDSESDFLTKSVLEGSADDNQIMQNNPSGKPRKG